MKMALDNASGVNTITRYESGRVNIRDRSFDTSLIIFPNTIVTDWPARRADTLGGADFKAIVEYGPEVLILGTGETQVFPEPAIFATLMDLGIGFEVMDNAAACRTYNILLAEDRQVALALIFP